MYVVNSRPKPEWMTKCLVKKVNTHVESGYIYSCVHISWQRLYWSGNKSNHQKLGLFFLVLFTMFYVFLISLDRTFFLSFESFWKVNKPWKSLKFWMWNFCSLTDSLQSISMAIFSYFDTFDKQLFHFSKNSISRCTWK